MHSTDESLSNQDKKKWKQKNKFTDASTFDNGVFDSLQQIISSIDITDEGASNDFQSIIEFFQKGFASQATQAWSYYAQVNNHHMFTDTSIKLTRTLKILNFDPSLHEYGSTLIGDILSKYAKVLYRGLNNLRPSITNPIIRLMKEIVSFHQGQHVDDFLSFFDLSLSSLPKILTPSKAELADVELAQNNSHFSMRFNFIKFWLALIENATPLLRKDILVENHKIMSTWVKHMNKVDTTELMEQTITVFMEKILQEKSFKKITKCKILNELVVSKIHGFYYSSSKNLVKQVDNFFQTYATDPQYSVAFSDDKLWFAESVFSVNLSGSSTGAPVQVNQKQFKLHNKLLFTMLTNFKPWEDDVQSNTVLKVLEHVPELIPPYCNFLASHGTHAVSYTHLDVYKRQVLFRDCLRNYVWILRMSAKSFEKAGNGLKRIHMLLTQIPGLLTDEPSQTSQQQQQQQQQQQVQPQQFVPPRSQSPMLPQQNQQPHQQNLTSVAQSPYDQPTLQISLNQLRNLPPEVLQTLTSISGNMPSISGTGFNSVSNFGTPSAMDFSKTPNAELKESSSQINNSNATSDGNLSPNTQQHLQQPRQLQSQLKQQQQQQRQQQQQQAQKQEQLRSSPQKNNGLVEQGPHSTNTCLLYTSRCV